MFGFQQREILCRHAVDLNKTKKHIDVCAMDRFLVILKGDDAPLEPDLLLEGCPLWQLDR